MKRFLTLVCLLFSSFLHATEIREETKLIPFFADRGIEGTFVLLDPQADVLHVYNRARAGQRYAPASTFKIANALIGLELKVVKDIDEVIPYGGGKGYLKEWEQDMNLRDAMKVSNVLVFHQMAKRVGIERMKQMLDAFDYGNREIGNDIDHRFWLREPLAISAFEQVGFLQKVATGKLPVRAEAVSQLKEIIRYEEKNGAVIYAKTGWMGPEEPQIGWWVGWIEKDGQAYPFALDIDVHKSEDPKQRIPIAMDCMKALGKY